ncbi:hypothetical protein PTKIN_Ptkin17bG0117900 [Pterospermum kingtungense]
MRGETQLLQFQNQDKGLASRVIPRIRYFQEKKKCLMRKEKFSDCFTKLCIEKQKSSGIGSDMDYLGQVLKDGPLSCGAGSKTTLGPFDLSISNLTAIGVGANLFDVQKKRNFAETDELVLVKRTMDRLMCSDGQNVQTMEAGEVRLRRSL